MEISRLVIFHSLPKHPNLHFQNLLAVLLVSGLIYLGLDSGRRTPRVTARNALLKLKLICQKI